MKVDRPAIAGGSTPWEVGASGPRNWRSAHETLVLFGVWLLATAGAAPVLRLRDAEARGLVWARACGAYAMVVVRASALAALLTISGAWNALRQARSSGAG